MPCPYEIGLLTAASTRRNAPRARTAHGCLGPGRPVRPQYSPGMNARAQTTKPPSGGFRNRTPTLRSRGLASRVPL
jgi:hypothetical protein